MFAAIDSRLCVPDRVEDLLTSYGLREYVHGIRPDPHRTPPLSACPAPAVTPRPDKPIQCVPRCARGAAHPSMKISFGVPLLPPPPVRSENGPRLSSRLRLCLTSFAHLLDGQILLPIGVPREEWP